MKEHRFILHRQSNTMCTNCTFTTPINSLFISFTVFYFCMLKVTNEYIIRSFWPSSHLMCPETMIARLKLHSIFYLLTIFSFSFHPFPLQTSFLFSFSLFLFPIPKSDHQTFLFFFFSRTISTPHSLDYNMNQPISF